MTNTNPNTKSDNNKHLNPSPPSPHLPNQSPLHHPPPPPPFHLHIFCAARRLRWNRQSCRWLSSTTQATSPSSACLLKLVQTWMLLAKRCAHTTTTHNHNPCTAILTLPDACLPVMVLQGVIRAQCPLLLAIENRQLRVVKYLLEQGADPNPTFKATVTVRLQQHSPSPSFFPPSPPHIVPTFYSHCAFAVLSCHCAHCNRCAVLCNTAARSSDAAPPIHCSCSPCGGLEPKRNRRRRAIVMQSHPRTCTYTSTCTHTQACLMCSF